MVGWSGETSSIVPIEEATALIGTLLLPWFEIWLRLPFDVPSESVEEVDFRRIGLFPREISLGYAEKDSLCEIREGEESDAEDPPANHLFAANRISLLSGGVSLLLREDVAERAFVMIGDSHVRPAPSEEAIGEGERDNSVAYEELSGAIAGCGVGGNDRYVVTLEGIDSKFMGELLPASWPEGEGDAGRDTER
jgi:hypothetical protein